MLGVDRNPRRWTPAEDDVLRHHVDAQDAQGCNRDWCQIALALPGRSNKDCRKRWHNSVTEGLKKGQWSKTEDDLLTRGVHRYGSQWTKVATCVSSRSADQCAKRWQQSLDPRLDRSEWRRDEDTALLTAVDSLGRHWKDIQERHLPHRSKNCIKNRYSVLTRRDTTRPIPYDDSIGSSSSDAGTPMQVQDSLPLDFMPASFFPGTSQPCHVQVPYMSGADMSWPWSDINNPSVTLPANYDPSDCNMWPVYSEAPLGHTTPSAQGPWVGSQSTTSPQQSMDYANTSHPHVHTYPYPVNGQMSNVSSMPCTSSELSSAYAYTPTGRTSHSSANEESYGSFHTST